MLGKVDPPIAGIYSSQIGPVSADQETLLARLVLGSQTNNLKFRSCMFQNCILNLKT